MTEEKKKPTPQQLAFCFIDQVARSNDKRSYDWWGKYSYDECIKGMDLTYLDEDSGWTPLNLAISRASYYFGDHSPCDRSLGKVFRSGRVTLDDLLKKPGNNKPSALERAAKYPQTFQKMLTFLFFDKATLEYYFRYNDWDDMWESRYSRAEMSHDLTMEEVLAHIRTNPKYDEKRIFSSDFWKIVAELDSDEKIFYKNCPGFKAEWLLNDYNYLKNEKQNFKDKNLTDALKKFKAVLDQDPTLKDKVDELKNGVKGLDIQYDYWTHYGEGLFGGPLFYEYEGKNLTPAYLEKLNQNYPNIERVSLPVFDKYKIQDFHYNLKDPIGDEQFEAVSKFKNVKHLSVGFQPGITPKAFDIIAGMNKLESVSFSGIEITKENLEKILKLPNLQELSLGDCEYDEKLIRAKTNLLYTNGAWVGPKHPDYKKAKELEDKRLAEEERIKSLTGKDWKEKFHAAMTAGEKGAAMEILELNHVFEKRSQSQNSSWKRQTHEEVGPHILTLFGKNEMHVRDDCISQDIAELGDDCIAVAMLYEDRDWSSSGGYSRGISWYWKGEVAIVHLDKGVGEMAETNSVCVRDGDDGNRDVWQYIDKEDILHIKNGKAIVDLGGYASASVKIPPTSEGKTLLKTIEEGEKDGTVAAARKKKGNKRSN